MGKEKKEAMWYKIQDLNKRHYKISQISRELSIDRETTRKYLKMSKEEFDESIKISSDRSKKLMRHYDTIESMLVECADLSASQIGDRLKERDENFEEVSPRTLYNFVQYVRKKSNIPKAKSSKREYEKVLELPYGLQAQCDFGSNWVQREGGGKMKVYFMAMVLSRSRAKYVVYQSKPFTTIDAINAHKKSFEYYGGCPIEIWYDQDRVFAVEENLGDFKFTEEFRKYVNDEVFEPKFCRKADPETKGKIENVVKFVKGNFLKGRKFKTIDLLQEQGDSWLIRTGNGKVHEGTKLIPLEELIKEKPYLKIPKNSFEMPKVDGVAYKLRKDNTLLYKSNYYTVPTGTYNDKESIVEVKEENGVLNIFDKNRCMIAKHYVSVQKGKTISKSDHRRDKSTSMNEKIEILYHKLERDEGCIDYLQKLKEKKPRNIHDELNNMLRIIKEFSDRELKEGILEARKMEIYNSNDIKDLIIKRRMELAEPKVNYPKIKEEVSINKYTEIQAIKSKIADFDKIFNRLNI